MITTHERALDNYYGHGDVTWGQMLEFPVTRNLQQFTHRVFNRYPARSIFLVPRSILAELTSSHQPPSNLRVVDPFMGSGTTAVEALLAGMQPYGVELDPFARLVSEVRTRVYDSSGMGRLQETFAQIVCSWNDRHIDPNLYPRLDNIEYWFYENTFTDLLRLKTAMYETANSDDLDFFRVVLADMIRPCSRAERQSLKPYVSRKYTKKVATVSEAFENSFRAHMNALEELRSTGVQGDMTVKWLGDDARSFTSTVQMDAAITSPPYINALDYVRCIKLESAWVGTGENASFNRLRRLHVGDSRANHDRIEELVWKLVRGYVEAVTEKDPGRGTIVACYFQDMFDNLRRTYDVLRTGAVYHVIVGENSIRGVHIPTYQVIGQLGEHAGFIWDGCYQYAIKDHRTSIPRKGNGGKVGHEWVVSLKKCKPNGVDRVSSSLRLSGSTAQRNLGTVVPGLA